MVVIVAPVAVTMEVTPVWKVTVPLLPPVDHGSGAFPQKPPSGGPLVTCGQGGRVALRVVVPPSPSGSRTPMGGMSTLGEATNPPVACPWVTLTLENGIPPPGGMVMIGISIVTVAVVVKKVVTAWVPIMVVPVCPYSNDVVKSPGSISVPYGRVLLGMTRMQGGEHLAVGAVQTSVPTYTTSILSSPGSGSHTLTSVVKPLLDGSETTWAHTIQWRDRGESRW